ncbi:Pterin-4-alpha-carbinolamine dehydratase [Trichoderma ghanense]|uniref:4a-hydroxytetrahydrobiopterin dehydratase n=1 Tax=Trichoderma ghanense TaxID=65468 RepID=A0ABY2H672_9HYPO
MSSQAPKLDTLLVPNGGRWTLTSDGEALERSFKFKNFTKTWVCFYSFTHQLDFMTAVSLQCKIHNHHPEWSNVYNTTFIRWTTHVPKGLSEKDISLASICDSLAKDFGELEPEPEKSSCEMRGLADEVVKDGSCCVKK